MSTGEGNVLDFTTQRGHHFPTIRQFTVFLENRVGQLLEVVRRFDGTTVQIVALSISESSECAFVRLLLSDPDQGREVLERGGLSIIETELIAVEVPEDPQPLVRICTALLRCEVNIIQTYPLLVRPHGRPVVAIMVDNLQMALETLDSQGLRALSEDDLLFDNFDING